jgi:AbrB family looped-hinge helix DNA binding protein
VADECDEKTCCGIRGSQCKVGSITSIDERGLMVLPKEIRDRMKIRAGDKLAIVCFEKDENICCLSLIKAEELDRMVKSMLGPVMDDALKK